MAQLKNLIVSGQSSLIGDVKASLITATTFKGALAGNATTATTLQTARTLTIGNTGKPVNGSADVSWSLAEIGAVNKAGDTMTGRLTTTNGFTAASPSQSFIEAKTGNTASFIISTKNSAEDYHPYLKAISNSDHVMTFGGYRNEFGFYGYESTVTENKTSWSARVLSSTGDWTFTGTITAPKFIGTASTAEKLGTATIGSKTKPIYLDAGVPKASDATVGSSTKPVYLNAGVLTACSRDIPAGTTLSAAGSLTQPVYINSSGVPTACTAYSSASVNYATTSGTASKLGSTTVGNASTPIYLSGGTPTACTSISVSKLGTSTVGSTTKPIYLNAGTPTAFSTTVGAGNKPIYMSGGALTACSSTVGSSSTPIYMSSGTLTACSSLSASYATSAGSASSATNADKATNASNVYGTGAYRPNQAVYLYFTTLDSTGYRQCSTNSDIRAKATSSYGEIWVGNQARGRLWIRGTGGGGNYLVSAASSTDYTTTLPSKTSTLARNAEPSFDEDGNIIPSENPINLGTLTYSPDTATHPLNQPVAMNESEIIPMTDTIGSDSAPMYLDGGEFRRATDIEATKVTIDSAMLDISNNGEEVAMRNNEQMIFSLPLIKETPSIYDVTTGGANLAASKLLNFYTQPNEGYSVLEVGAPVIDNLDEYGINEESLGALNLSGGKYGQTTLYAGTNESLVIGSERGANNKGGIVFSDYTTGEDYHIPIVKYGYSFNPDTDLLDAPIGSVYYEIEQTGSKWKKIVNTYVKTE